MRKILIGSLLACAALVAGCGGRTIRIDLIPAGERLEEQVIESADATLFTTDKIAMVTVSGLIANMKSGGGLLGSGQNKVSDFRETLDAIARDPAIKAVVLRINSPGGTVTASAMVYQDVLNFKKKSGKPVVTCMMDVCASGGYYLSCASDYRIAYPTTITGSIGVIIETVNFNGTLKKIGVATEAVKSGPNKDMGSPFKPPANPDAPLSDADRVLLQNVVQEFYDQFKLVVKTAPHKVADADWDRLTDGRVVTGKEAARVGLIDEVGDLDTAINKAKQLAGIQKAKIVVFSRIDESHGSIYAKNPGNGNTQPQVNMINLNVDLGGLIPHGQSEFLYLWTGFGSSDE